MSGCGELGSPYALTPFFGLRSEKAFCKAFWSRASRSGTAGELIADLPGQHGLKASRLDSEAISGFHDESSATWRLFSIEDGQL